MLAPYLQESINPVASKGYSELPPLLYCILYPHFSVLLTWFLFFSGQLHVMFTPLWNPLESGIWLLRPTLLHPLVSYIHYKHLWTLYIIYISTFRSYICTHDANVPNKYLPYF